MKVAIIALTRGYPNNRSSYDSLIKRNKAIYSNLNSLRNIPADMILFHEGNISIEDQEFINSKYPGTLIFKDVSKYFKSQNLKLEGEEKFTLGYRQMCRFNMFHIWDEVSNYDYVFRIDEDIEVLDVNPNIFEYLKENKITYMTGRYTKDIHRLTNKTLPYFLLKNTDLNVKKIYNHRNPYTNLYISSVKFWKTEDVQSYLKTIALTDEQIIYRWGDHTVQGLILNYKNVRINLFPKLVYKHPSHSLIIKNTFLRNLTINSKFNPVSVKEGLYTKFKLRLKAKFKNSNPFDFDNN